MKKLFALVALTGILFIAIPREAKADVPCQTMTVYCCDSGWTGIVCSWADYVYYMTRYCVCDEEGDLD